MEESCEGGGEGVVRGFVKVERGFVKVERVVKVEGCEGGGEL